MIQAGLGGLVTGTIALRPPRSLERFWLGCARWPLLWAVPPSHSCPCEMVVLKPSLSLMPHALGATTLDRVLRGASLRHVLLR